LVFDGSEGTGNDDLIANMHATNEGSSDVFLHVDRHCEGDENDHCDGDEDYYGEPQECVMQE
jgi:hypothetical protein